MAENSVASNESVSKGVAPPKKKDEAEKRGLNLKRTYAASASLNISTPGAYDRAQIAKTLARVGTTPTKAGQSEIQSTPKGRLTWPKLQKASTSAERELADTKPRSHCLEPNDVLGSWSTKRELHKGGTSKGGSAIH